MVESIDGPEHTTINNDSINSDPDLLETAKWTRFLPEAFGIRESVRGSSYRWCVREGGMWGIATATAMSLHRLRAGSKVDFSFYLLSVCMTQSFVFITAFPTDDVLGFLSYCIMIPATSCRSFVFWNLYGGDAPIILFLLSTT